jgi:agarase
MAQTAGITPTNPATTDSAEALRFETARGTAGFFRATQDAGGRWWLVDADDRPFFCKAVHGVRATPANTEASASPFAVANADAATRLRRWGFNAVGAGGDGAGRDDGMAFMASVEFCRAGALIHAPGARLPDVFDPDWPRRATAHAAEVCLPLVNERRLIGWLADDLLGWAQANVHATPAAARAPRPTLLQICLSLEPAFAAYHAAWEFTLALHGGKLEAVARAWGTPLANKEVVRELTRTEHGLATRGYLRDHARWTAEFARRYFATTAAAIRAADPQHLVLGARGNGPASESVFGACIAPAVDVALLDWRELPPASIAAAPVLAGDFCWAEPALYAPPAAGRARELTTVERMLRRGRAAFTRTARHAAVCGYVWPQWLDEPGEQPPFARGLVHGNGAEAREHTELLADLNARAEALHRTAATPVALSITP